MATAQDYPVTFPYGAKSAPYGTSALPYHRGEDRYMPSGTPILVNGVQIGLSGATGFVTGAHLHIGRWVGGRDTNPGGGGFYFNNAVVTEVGQDATNGKFVRVQGDGASWVYLHMSQPTASVNQVLKPTTNQGGSMASDKTIEQVFAMGLDRAPDPGAYNTYRPLADSILVNSVYTSGERATRVQQRAQQIAELVAALTNERNKPPKEVIKEVEKIVEVIKEVPVEVIKEVPIVVDEKAVVQSVLVRFWNSLFKKGVK